MGDGGGTFLFLSLGFVGAVQEKHGDGDVDVCAAGHRELHPGTEFAVKISTNVQYVCVCQG